MRSRVLMYVGSLFAHKEITINITEGITYGLRFHGIQINYNL